LRYHNFCYVDAKVAPVLRTAKRRKAAPFAIFILARRKVNGIKSIKTKDIKINLIELKRIFKKVKMKVTPINLFPPDGRRISLTCGREYEVLGIEADDYRILNDENTQPYGNDPVLFEKECFKIIEQCEPAFWVCEIGNEGERYCYPPEWSHPGFFEDYHDGKKDVRNKFQNELKNYYPNTWQERNK
jgi:hypothetical protein